MNKHDKEKLMLEYDTQIKEIIKKMQSQLPELRKNYKGEKGLIDQWEKKIKEVVQICRESCNLDEMSDILAKMKEMINTGLDRIQQNISPFDDTIFRKKDYQFEHKNTPYSDNTVRKELIDKSLIRGLCCLFCAILYALFAFVGCGPVVLTVVFALFLFPNAVPSRFIPSNIRHSLGFIISMIIGGYLNIYVYALPDTERKIWLCGLPVVCALIYWGVNRQRKVKDL